MQRSAPWSGANQARVERLEERIRREERELQQDQTEYQARKRDEGDLGWRVGAGLAVREASRSRAVHGQPQASAHSQDPGRSAGILRQH